MGDDLAALRARFGDVQVERWRKMCRDGGVADELIDEWIVEADAFAAAHIDAPAASASYKISLVIATKLQPLAEGGGLSADGLRLRGLMHQSMMG